jgi:hypothetical protein
MEIIDTIGSIRLYDSESATFQLFYPCVKVKGVWHDTDISELDTEFQEFCTNAWTDSIKQNYKDHVDTNLVEE